MITYLKISHNCTIYISFFSVKVSRLKLYVVFIILFIYSLSILSVKVRPVLLDIVCNSKKSIFLLCVIV